MGSVGRDLKSIREERKVSLLKIAQVTRININYLQYLEDGRYGDLPGGMYNRAFLRTYCECLGLNPAEYLERYEAEIAPPNERATKSKSKKPMHGNVYFRPHPLMAWGVMLLISVVGLYFSRSWISSVFSPYFSRTPAASMPAPVLPVPQMPDQQRTAQAVPVGSVQSPAQSEASGSVQASSVTQAEPGDQAPGVKSPPPPPAPGTIRIEFHVIETCWVSVSSDGARVQKLLEPGEDQYFDAVERFYIILGNAGGVQMKINGKAAKPLGKSGEVVHMLVNQQNMSELLARNTG